VICAADVFFNALTWRSLQFQRQIACCFQYHIWPHCAGYSTGGTLWQDVSECTQCDLENFL